MRSKALNAVIRKPEVKTVCSHHWLIETADGPTSLGICKYCGAKKEFSNIFFDPMSNDDNPSPIEAVDLDDSKDDIDDNVELLVGASV